MAENNNQVETKEIENKSNGKVVEVKAKKTKQKKEKNKKPSKIAKSLKDTGAELKKVTWPKFKEVEKLVSNYRSGAMRLPDDWNENLF